MLVARTENYLHGAETSTTRSGDCKRTAQRVPKRSSGALLRAARQIQETGTFTFLGQAISFQQANSFMSNE